LNDAAAHRIVIANGNDNSNMLVPNVLFRYKTPKLFARTFENPKLNFELGRVFLGESQGKKLALTSLQRYSNLNI